MKVVLKLSGHLLFPYITHEKITEYAEAMKKILSLGHEAHAVVGGGIPARQYIEAARKLGVDEASCDKIGILISQINAMLLIKALGDKAYHRVPQNFEELEEALASKKSVILGGLQPGQSTSAVAALLAERLKADLIIFTTDVDGVYTEDPKISPGARKIDEISVRELKRLVLLHEAKAGGYKLMDLVALSIIERAKIPAVVINGTQTENIFKVITGEKIGTKITP
ncbi:MAG: UMP kinase [Candidatus Methanomethylicota archaeon]|uniref:Uridylate kinase n=1 Tax=Thermoproteota archaeon TaxID=2056631 RepID=A0A497ERC2_9CREN|nr:MAG: UMP kinase [Candidatus Verstraetearchaeota archaeon]RLE52504.1 MAG: UMP kinase [Candidatus Verstraetearchaeota archaeon]